MRVLATVLFLFAFAAYAQTTGAIEGAVADSSMAAIPGVAVKVTNTNTSVSYATTSNSAGYYLVEGLPAGVYEIDVNQTGFKAYAVKDIQLDIAERVRQDIRLTVGQLTESVTVEASAAQVDTASGTVGGIITHEQIDTAVLNGRHYARLAMLLPGAVYHSAAMSFRARV